MADEEQTVIDMQPTQEEEQHRQQQGGSSTWCHDCNFWICVHGEDTSCQCPDCNCECPDCSGLDCDCGGLDCTIMWTFKKKHNLYKITYIQVVPYKSIKNMLCPSNHSIRTSEQSPDTDQDCKSEQYFKNDVTPTMFFVLFTPKNF